MTDEELYRSYLDGDETGLAALMDQYGNALTLYIDGYLGDIHEAEDLMIEVFSYLLVKRPHIRDGGLKAYLYKAARHMALRHKRRRPVVFSLENLAEEPEARALVEEVIKNREQSRILHLCMEHLNAGYREALYLTYFEGLSYAQAAQVMGKSVKQITNMIYRGKQCLRELLEKEGITHAE
ncbi:MAG: RNA polymerase sigma factor [Massilistercora timonensis]